jgi:hypothetical protein
MVVHAVEGKQGCGFRRDNALQSNAAQPTSASAASRNGSGLWQDEKLVLVLDKLILP